MADDLGQNFLEAVFKTRELRQQQQELGARMQFSQMQLAAENQRAAATLDQQKQYQQGLLQNDQARTDIEGKRLTAENQARALGLQLQGAQLAQPTDAPTAPTMAPAGQNPGPAMALGGGNAMQSPVGPPQALQMAPPGATEVGGQMLRVPSPAEKVQQMLAQANAVRENDRQQVESTLQPLVDSGLLTREQAARTKIIATLTPHLGAEAANAIFGKNSATNKSPSLDDYVEMKTTGKSTAGFAKDMTPDQVKALGTAGVNELKPPKPEKDMTDANYRIWQQSYNTNIRELDNAAKPITDMSQRMAKLDESLAQNNAKGDALVAPELLTAMAGGAGSGLRMTEPELTRIIGSRTAQEDLKAKLTYFSSHPDDYRTLTPHDHEQIQKLTQAMKDRYSKAQDTIRGAYRDLATAPQQQHAVIVNRVREAIMDANNSKSSSEPAASSNAVHWGRDANGKPIPVK